LSSKGKKFLSSGPLSFPVKSSLKGINKLLPFKPVCSIIDLVHLSHVSYVNGSSGMFSIAAFIKLLGISCCSIEVIASIVLTQIFYII